MDALCKNRKKSRKNGHLTSTRPIRLDGNRSGPTHPTSWISPPIRTPRASDAAGVWRLVRESGVLDANSPYAYLLLCTDFAETSAVAEGPEGVAGFVVGYRPPARPDTVFVWQVGVADTHRGRGLGRTLLDWVVSQTSRASEPGVRFLEATVTPSNEASWSLFRSFAREAGAPLQEETAFAAELFPGAEHEAEVRIRIGPLHPGRNPKEV
jgi:L-2,4-diaminobutyric acid acetyltransferase